MAEANQKVVDENPCARPSNRKQCRDRDHERRDGKVLNPFHVSLGACIVCKFFFRKSKPTRTARYCRECCTDPSWPETSRAKGWQKQFQPRLCSKKCFDIFHTTRISGLDYRQMRRRKRRKNTAAPTPAQRSRRESAVARAATPAPAPRYDV